MAIGIANVLNILISFLTCGRVARRRRSGGGFARRRHRTTRTL